MTYNVKRVRRFRQRQKTLCGGKMRRRLFTFTLLLTLCLFALQQIGVPLRMNELSLDGFYAENDENTGDSRGSIVCVGKVVKIQEKEGKHSLRVRLSECNGSRVDFCEDVLLNIYSEAERPWELLCAEIAFSAELRDADGERNPHCFDYHDYLKSCGIGKVATVKTYQLLKNELTIPEKYERFLYRSRCEFLAEISAENRGIIAGVLFGDTSYLEEELYDEFRSNGTAHILAVSGLHVGILYGIYKKIAGKRRSAGALLLLALLLFTYGTLSMWSPSATRAILMISVSTVGRFADRRYDRLSALSVAALILIADNPYVILGTGFQMSFLAIASISFFVPIVPKKVPESLAAALAVNFGLLLYQVQTFNYISIVALAANIPIIYLTGYFVPLALLAFLISMTGIGFEPANAATEGFAMLLTKLNHLSTLGGFSAIDVPSLPTGIAAFIICMSFFLASESFFLWRARKNRKSMARICLLVIILSVAAETAAYSPITHDELIFADVGQGDCIHIRAGGKNILIDGGGKSEYNVGKKTLKPYLLKNGVRRLDAAIATHKHTDHYKGLSELAECFELKMLLTDMTAGRAVTISDGIFIETLWPLEIDNESTQDANESCSVFMLYYEDRRILITGDLDSEGEKAMLAYYKGTDKLSADVLKVGHHGSKYSSCEEFLQAVNPKLAVIQVGKNTYGHPAAEALERLEKQGCRIYRNDESGAIGLRFEKNEIKIHTVLSKVLEIS